jgi:hypothetical protein
MGEQKADPERELVLAYLRNQQLEAVEDYLKRGRKFADIDDRELDQRWVAAFKSWVAWAARSGIENDRTQRLDLDSEIILRGREPPYESVVDEWRQMAAIVKAQVSQPDAREKLESTAKEILEFEKSGRKKPVN